MRTYLVMSYTVSQNDRQEMIDDPKEHASNAQVGQLFWSRKKPVLTFSYDFFYL